MKICMITDTYHPSFDGIVRYLDYLIPKLLEKGHEVSVVCPWFSGEQHYSSPEPGLSIIRTRTTRFKINAYFFALPDRRLIREILKADFVIVHSLMPLGTVGGLFAKLFRKKIGFWCHHDERVILNDIVQVPPLVVRLMYKFMRKFYRGIVDVFFHATERFKRKLLSFGAPHEKLIHTPFAINKSKFHPKPAIDLRKRYNIPTSAIIATYLGRLSVEKNVDNILLALDQAMDEIPNLYALIVGGGPDREKFQSLPRVNKDRFIFTGFIPEDELQSHYACSDLFVTPTLNESSCFTVFEAMTCQVPIITSAKDHDPDIVHMENALLVNEVLNVSEITEKILLLAANHKFRKFIAWNGFKLINSRTWENHAQKFLASLELHIQEEQVSLPTEKGPARKKPFTRLRKAIGL